MSWPRVRFSFDGEAEKVLSGDEGALVRSLKALDAVSSAARVKDSQDALLVGCVFILLAK
ncbi:MAG: hypothetical protein IT291_09935 [Deltaproteobacteria bacterium]|nr:hypothetical protein [Deltaproteobacteria bacterium]